jgi:hypothetical protein
MRSWKIDASATSFRNDIDRKTSLHNVNIEGIRQDQVNIGNGMVGQLHADTYLQKLDNFLNHRRCSFITGNESPFG